MEDALLRFVIGGVVVSTFAFIGDVVKPKSFAGLFGAAPSVALATLALTVATSGGTYAGIECRSMVVGAIALGVYSLIVMWLLIRRHVFPLKAALASLAAWFAVAFGLWLALLR